MEQQVRAFADSGFVVIPGVLDDRTRERWWSAVDRTVATVRATPEEHDTRYTLHTEQGTDTWGVSHIFESSLYDPVFAEVFEYPGVMGFVRAVLGDRLRFWTAHALWEPSVVDYELNWHKDNMETNRYAPDGRSSHVQFNICLTADDCFRVVPGSHRRPLTAEECAAVAANSTDPLPDQTTVRCRPGDVLFMNHHALHRGSGAAGVLRRTLHVNIQAADEPTGGHTSWRFMRQRGYLERMTPVVRELMENTITWDDDHPLPVSEVARRMRVSRDIKRYEASAGKRTSR
jgi:hypothetical protein